MATTAKKRKEATVENLVDVPLPPRPPRLVPLHTVEQVNAVPYFDDEEKQLAIEMLLRSLRLYGNQATMTVATALHDPKGAAAKFRYGEELSALIGNSGENRHTVQGTLLHLLVLSVLKFTKDEALVGALSAGNGRMAPGFKQHHLMLMEFPESEVWSAEQRLMLRYVQAVLHHRMTDELWNQAVEAWGVKMCLRYLQYMGHFFTTGIRNRALNVTHPLFRDDGYVSFVS
jgi:hypothetical protein